MNKKLCCCHMLTSLIFSIASLLLMTPLLVSFLMQSTSCFFHYPSFSLSLNTVELTHSGLPDREQLVSVRLNSLRPKAANTTL